MACALFSIVLDFVKLCLLSGGCSSIKQNQLALLRTTNRLVAVV